MKPGLCVAVDGPNLVFKFFHTTKDSKNHAADVAKRFADRLLRLAKYFQPQYGVVCWDSGSTFRSFIYPEYKAGRERDDRIPETLIACRVAAENLFRPGGRWRGDLRQFNAEADDLMASIAAQYPGKVILSTSDKDLRQCLVSGRVSILKNIRGEYGALGDPEWWTAQRLKEECFVYPHQWVDYQVLVGDRSDNIAGAKGIGPKRAMLLLSSRPNIESILAADPPPSALTPKRRAAIEALDLDLSRQLFTLKTNLEVPLSHRKVDKRQQELF